MSAQLLTETPGRACRAGQQANVVGDVCGDVVEPNPHKGWERDQGSGTHNGVDEACGAPGGNDGDGSTDREIGDGHDCSKLAALNARSND